MATCESSAAGKPLKEKLPDGVALSNSALIVKVIGDAAIGATGLGVVPSSGSLITMEFAPENCSGVSSGIDATVLIVRLMASFTSVK
jgi:hypothetical protein